MADAVDYDDQEVWVGFGAETLLIYNRGPLGMQWAVHLTPPEAIKLAERILQGCDERDWK